MGVGDRVTERGLGPRESFKSDFAELSWDISDHDHPRFPSKQILNILYLNG